MRSEPTPHVAIVGAGFSGTMLAVHLCRLGARVTLIDRRGRFAEGLAYSTREPVHLLNVRAGNMSAYPDAPDHFAQWLEARGEGSHASFAKRCSYRAYLAEILRGTGKALSCVEGEARGLDGTRLLLVSGARIDADAVVVAAGNLPPAPFSQLAALGGAYVNDPWTVEGRAAVARLASKGGDVLALGTGLTMVDTVLALESHGFAGRVVALSRRGQMPEAHRDFAPVGVEPPTANSPDGLLRWARRQSVANDWRAVVDSLRPRTGAIWRSWSTDEQARFLRHLRPWWDVRRHRIAPQVWEQLQAMIGCERLQVRVGRLAGLEEERITVRARGGEAGEPVDVAAVVNCTGPRGNIRRSGDPLIEALLSEGTARADALGLGLDVDENCRVIGAAGSVTEGVYAIGPMTKGAFWEIVAVPDIRGQAQALAATIMADAASAVPASAWQAA